MTETDHTLDAIDTHVGRRVRHRRKSLGISQTSLGASAGVTFQQIQKYERAQNRISASVLYRFSQLLGVPVSYFFEGLYGSEVPTQVSTSDYQSPIQLLLSSKEGLEFAYYFPKISAPAQREALLQLTKTLTRDC